MNDRPPLPTFGRRRFVQLVSLAVGAGAVSGCRSAGPSSASPGSSPATAGTAPPTISPATTPSSTTIAPTTAAPGVSRDGRALVVVQLNGGNDVLNTLVPDDVRYRDARPTIAIDEAELVRFDGLDARSVHPSLAPLAASWGAGRLALVEGVGFPDPDRSHFVAMDRWWTADGMTTPAGWLGAAGDLLGGSWGPLSSVALLSGAPVLRGDERRPVEIRRPAEFEFAAGVDLELLRALGEGEASDPLTAAVLGSYAQAIDATARFAEVKGAAAGSDDEVGGREGDASLAGGLATAARLVAAGESRLVAVSAGGFDTHAGQLAAHAPLLADLAEGLTAFDRIVAEADRSGEVVVLVVSEFGRRVAENGSGGTDHGKAGLALLLGDGVAGGLHGGVDLGDLDDGDLRAAIDPRAVFTACLDWIGVEAERVLGRRFDGPALLR